MAAVTAPSVKLLQEQEPAKPSFLSTEFRATEDSLPCEDTGCEREAAYWVSFGRGIKRALCGLHETLTHAEWKHGR